MVSSVRTPVKVVLLDIEGTVCSISFVKDVLFPYSLNALPGVLAAKWEDAAFAPYLDAFPSEHRGSPDAVEAHVRDLVSRDVKVAYLKSLQGYLWQAGYESGRIKAPLFEDVAPTIEAWRKDGVSVMIYSSGCVPAQKLLFGHTNADPADLQPSIDGWFDTVNAGPKTEAASYAKIAATRPDVDPAQWLFLSDNPREVRPALETGMQSLLVVRPGNEDVSGAEYQDLIDTRVWNFLDLDKIGRSE